MSYDFSILILYPACRKSSNLLPSDRRSRVIFDCMAEQTKSAIEDDLRDAIEEDEREALAAELRRRGLVDDAEEWLSLA